MSLLLQITNGTRFAHSRAPEVEYIEVTQFDVLRQTCRVIYHYVDGSGSGTTHTMIDMQRFIESGRWVPMYQMDLRLKVSSGL